MAGPSSSQLLGRVVVPDTLCDDENSKNSHGSTAVREQLVELACRQQYTQADVLQLCTVNPGVEPRADELLQQAASAPVMPHNELDDEAGGDLHAEE